MTTGKSNLADLIKELGEGNPAELLNVLIAAGHIGTALRKLPDAERLNTCATLSQALQSANSDLDGLGKIAVQASIDTCNDVTYLYRVINDLQAHFLSP